MPDTDPFTQVHNALVSLAKANAVLAALVPNIVELKGDRSDAAQTDASVEELPRLLLTPDDDLLKDIRDSHKATITAVWNWELDTGEKWPRDTLYQVIWELFRSMAQGRDTLKASLTWSSGYFVYDVIPQNCRADWDVRNRNRNNHGWHALFACHVLMQFDRTTLPPT